MSDPLHQARPCICGHDIWEHEDYDFNIHECTHSGCDCKQFRDVEDGRSNAAESDEGSKK